MKFFTWLTVTLMLLAAGCTVQNSPSHKPQTQQQSAKADAQINTELAGRVEETAKRVKAVDDSVAVVIDRDISIAVKVTGFDRLRLKSIRKEVHEGIVRLTPEYTVHVTTDKKLFSELRKLTKQIQQGGNPTQIQTKLETINKNMRG